MKLPRLIGEFSDNDTQFMHTLKRYQEFLFLGVCGVVILVIFSLVLTYTGGRQGTWRYAVCRIFMERYVEYPNTIEILTAAEKNSSAEIGYMVTNAFGSREAELMECFYNVDNNGIEISQVKIDRIPIDPEEYESFNPTIGTILGQEELDYTLPDDFPEDLEDYKTE